MSIQTIIRAWKDAEFRMSLSDAERAALPANPAGGFELSDAELARVNGGGRVPTWTMAATCVTCMTRCVMTCMCVIR
jgi:mersacidin/lichenicidin family type 2 lantibiotic